MLPCNVISVICTSRLSAVIYTPDLAVSGIKNVDEIILQFEFDTCNPIKQMKKKPKQLVNKIPRVKITNIQS